MSRASTRLAVAVLAVLFLTHRVGYAGDPVVQIRACGEGIYRIHYSQQPHWITLGPGVLAKLEPGPVEGFALKTQVRSGVMVAEISEPGYRYASSPVSVAFAPSSVHVAPSDVRQLQAAKAPVLILDVGDYEGALKLMHAVGPTVAIVAVNASDPGARTMLSTYPKVIRLTNNVYWDLLWPEHVPPMIVFGANSVPCTADPGPVTDDLPSASPPGSSERSAPPSPLKARSTPRLAADRKPLAKCACSTVGARRHAFDAFFFAVSAAGFASWRRSSPRRRRRPARRAG